jgi:predicted enzyme related to lactoylglutathione lyase
MVTDGTPAGNRLPASFWTDAEHRMRGAPPMSERSEYGRGEFCWVELVSPDADAAAQFYGDLLGWERERYEPDPEGYWYFRREGKLVAGLETFRTEGQVPAWLGYVRVDDVTAAAGKVGDAGGTVLAGPLDVPGGAGSLAVCQDTEGAVFAVWQPGELQGAQLVNELGCWTWNNLMTRDVDAAQDFYSKVFGWTAAQPEGAPEYIWNWQVDNQRWPEGLAGLMRMGADMPPVVPPHWQVYFVVDNADAAVARNMTAGGSLIFGPVDIPIARMVTVVDPQGAYVSLLESRYPEPR